MSRRLRVSLLAVLTITVAIYGCGSGVPDSNILDAVGPPSPLLHAASEDDHLESEPLRPMCQQFTYARVSGHGSAIAQFAPYGTLQFEVSVQDERAGPVRNVEVAVTHRLIPFMRELPADSSFRASTNEAGEATIRVPPGVFRFEAVHPDYTGAAGILRVRGGAHDTIRVIAEGLQIC